MKSLRPIQWIVPFLALALGLGVSWQLAAEEAVTAQVMQTGKGWQLIDTVPSGNTAGRTLMWEVSSYGIQRLPVSQVQKDLISEAFADDPDGGDSPIFMSEELLAAMEQPSFPAGYEQYIDPEEEQGLSLSLCHWDTETRNRTWSYSESLYSQNLPFSNGIQGQLTLDLPVTGQVNVAATYKIRKCLGVPVGFRFVGATANGNAALAGDGDLEASLSTSAIWEKEWKLAEPELGEVSFSIGWIPVRLVFTLPVYAGARFEAAFAGEVSAHLEATASGTFSYNCTTDTCSGTSDFTDQFEFTGPDGQATLDLEAQAHARVMLRVGLYSSNFAYVEGGFKAYAKAGIWGYAGNTCGDANGDGTNDPAVALVADLSWGYQFAYGMGGWLLPDDLEYTGGHEYLIGWRDLLGPGGSTVFAPMIVGPSTVAQGAPVTYTLQMRPCYPYTDPVTLTMAPGTWTGGGAVTPPAGTTTVQRTFSSPGDQTVVATATTDSRGRNLQAPTSRPLSVTATPPAAPTALAASAPASMSVQLNWTDNSNNETQFEVERRPYQSGSFVKIGSVGANVGTYTSGANPPTGSYQFRVRSYNSLTSAWSNTASLIVYPAQPPTTSIAWIQTAESTWGPAGTLTAAGYAANGTGTVQLVWRERSTTGVWGAWTAVAYQATPATDTTWSNTISSGNPTNKCHWFDAYTVYSGVTSAVFHYTGTTGCP